MKTKPSVSLLLFSVAALAFVGMLSFSEYAFLCRMVILVCVAAIVAVKLVQADNPQQIDKRTPEEIEKYKEVRNKALLWPLAFSFGAAATIVVKAFLN